MTRPDWHFNRHDENQGARRRLGAGLTTRVFDGHRSTLSIVRVEPHSENTLHSHPEEQWGVLLEGECTRIQDGQEARVTAGDFWHTPPGVLHGVRTGQDAAVILDVFCPRRVEYSAPAQAENHVITPVAATGAKRATFSRATASRATLEHRERSYEIAYFLRPGSQPPILYLHGLGSTKEDFLGAWERPELGRHALVAFDFPGCGESSSYYPEVPLGIDDLVAVTRKLVGLLELRDLAVIGQSLGGLTALQFASRYPDLITHFVNVEGNLAPGDCDIQSRDVFRHRFLGDEDEFFRRVERRLRDSGKRAFARFAERLRSNIVDRAYFDYCRSIVDYSDGFPLLEQFIGLPFPRLFVHGDANAGLPYLPTLESSGVPVLSVPDSDHFPAASNPTFYYGAISRFLEETEGGPSSGRSSET